MPFENPKDNVLLCLGFFGFFSVAAVLNSVDYACGIIGALLCFGMGSLFIVSLWELIFKKKSKK